MEQMQNMIKPELLVLVPVLYFVGMGLKKSKQIADKWIPFLLGAGGVILSLLWVMATTDMSGYQDVLMGVFVGIVQGILCAGASVYANQMVKQGGKAE